MEIPVALCTEFLCSIKSKMCPKNDFKNDICRKKGISMTTADVFGNKRGLGNGG